MSLSLELRYGKIDKYSNTRHLTKYNDMKYILDTMYRISHNTIDKLGLNSNYMHEILKCFKYINDALHNVYNADTFIVSKYIIDYMNKLRYLDVENNGVFDFVTHINALFKKKPENILLDEIYYLIESLVIGFFTMDNLMLCLYDDCNIIPENLNIPDGWFGTPIHNEHAVKITSEISEEYLRLNNNKLEQNVKDEIYQLIVDIWDNKNIK